MRTLLIVVLLAASAAGGFLLYRLFGGDGGGPTLGTVAPAADTHRPDFALPDLTGNVRSIAEWRDVPLIVNFWATWCAPCRREIPLLIALQDTHAPGTLQVIGVAIDEVEAVQRFAAETGIDYPVLVGEQAALDAAEAFGLAFTGLPFTAFIRADGRVQKVHLGELEAGELTSLVAEILPAR
ncbi:TlpA disulfide reductase family protein [soil metagenome]